MEPQLEEEERMVYVAFSESFFDSAMESYFQAGALQLTLVGDKVCQACLRLGEEGPMMEGSVTLTLS